MISLNAQKLESTLLAEPHVAVMISCRTMTRSEKKRCRTLQVAEPKALNLEKDFLAEPWIVGSFWICPVLLAGTTSEFLDSCPATLDAETTTYTKKLVGEFIFIYIYIFHIILLICL